MIIDKQDEIAFSLLHYFVTIKNYEALIVHGVKDEIWLQNITDGMIVRIVKNYIHNDEQMKFDIFKTKQVVQRLKMKTFSFNLNVVTFYLNLSEYVKLPTVNKMLLVNVQDINDIKTNEAVLNYFDDIVNKLRYNKQDMNELIMLTNEINIKNEERNQILDNVFGMKKPIITYGLITLNVIVFLFMMAMPSVEALVKLQLNFSNNAKVLVSGEWYRLITSVFMHANLLHLIVNMYALSIVGKTIESYFGKVKYLLIYLLSGITSSLLSSLFLKSSVSLGASGAIFGLLGAFLYFAYKYRMYMAGVIKNQLLPIIVVNLAIGLVPGIDMAGHIGGFVSGLLIAFAVGDMEDKKYLNNLNGLIMYVILNIFLILLLLN